ncbi:Sucrose-phosphate synthase 1 [Citrus sinensis]|uniref:Sucrose-phosphate synthase 1 n=1 Tax=Citrus sinensis TaxID=2711 RepID=A0ACB8NNC7_CITSI|nr:Sucrose-phosphate synthase 1 [Citrus sinensis]KAH9799025.1 Sucrose-phosphate synthase 1 [Citrus sinensis]
MAGNDWVNSYLEAILDVGPGIDDAKSSLLLRERGRFSPTRYFVEQVITGFDETDLHRSWIRAAATRSPQERNTRLENMCWRIWNLARKKKQIEGEEAQRKAKRRLERERGRKEASADMSEDLSEGDKGDVSGELSAHGGSTRGRMPRISSVDTMENWAIHLHGLIRGENMELGRDSDTGGQVKYVVELARALGSMPGVYRVDLLTRQVSAPDVDWTYAEPSEMLNRKNTENLMQGLGESSGAYIIRIPFGPKDKYVQKELLWPHIPEFVDAALTHIIQISKVLGEQVGSGQPIWPVAIHGHYADAGDAAALLSGALNVPMVFTGHSLGRDKLEQLLKQGRLSRDEINTTYKIMRRIEAEELSLDASEIVITSTRQEIEEQWRLYDGFDPVLERKLRARIKRGVSCHGRFMPRMVVIPPGIEFHHIVRHNGDVDGEVERDEGSPASPDPPIWSEELQNVEDLFPCVHSRDSDYSTLTLEFLNWQIMHFFSNPRKPMILALARPDPKKNITTLVKAFGECRPLRELANLTLIMGNRDDIDEMSGTNAALLLSILKLIDKYDLYGQVAYPKHHKQSDVPDIYRLAAKTKGVFINPAFIEPFGLTLIEAAAYGLPIVATKNGGPVDIHRVLDNGLLVDPHDQQSIADALLKLVSDKQLWERCRQNGLKNIHQFSWPEHCKSYLSRISSCKQRQPRWQRSDDGLDNSESDSPGDSWRDIHDLSLNLKLSLEGDKNEGGSTLDNSLDTEENAVTGKNKLENAVLALSNRTIGGTQKADHNVASGKFPALRRRKYVFVIAADCDTTSDFLEIIKKVVEAAGKDNSAGFIGFVLSTALTILELHSLLVSGGLSPLAFDAFICNSGSELYYPSSSTEDNHGLPFLVDLDYRFHTEYRWGGEGLRKTLVRWAASVNDKKGEEGKIVEEDESRSTIHCYAFEVTNPQMIPPVKELRKLMRIQALRCHVIYCQNGTKLHVIPVLASRSQALRYLHVRWGIDLSNVVVIAGECGDTDYEGLLGGVHKTVILKGVGESARKLHANRNYSLEDVISFDSHNVIQVDEACDSYDIRASLEKLGVLKGQ